MTVKTNRISAIISQTEGSNLKKFNTPKPQMNNAAKTWPSCKRISRWKEKIKLGRSNPPKKENYNCATEY